jgi:GNAT superfamily N-acetyltransferase
MTLLVRPARLEEVAALRQEVLRPGQPLDTTHYAEDEGALHMAAFLDGAVVGTATFFLQPFPGPGEADGPDDAEVPAEALGLVAWRLRGMATDAQRRSAGVGSAVLGAGLQAVRAAGGELVWCNARTAALTFYERHGFVPIGSQFMSGGSVEVPHYRAWVRLAG